MIELEKMAERQGAVKAKVIPVGDIRFDPTYRKHCEANYCGKYNTNYGCPPDAGTAEELIDKAAGFQYGLVYFTTHQVEDYRDSLQTRLAAREHWEIASCIEREICAKTKAYLRLGVGECLRCSCCAKVTGEPCRGGVVSSISAYCVDAASLAATCGIDLTPKPGEILYIGIVFFHRLDTSL